MRKLVFVSSVQRELAAEHGPRHVSVLRGPLVETSRRPETTLRGPVRAQSEAQSGAQSPTKSPTKSPSKSPNKSPTKSSDPVERLLQALEAGEKSAAELRESLGIKHLPTLQSNGFHPATEQGLVEMTRPDKPTSRLQNHRLTSEGRRVAWGA